MTFSSLKRPPAIPPPVFAARNPPGAGKSRALLFQKALFCPCGVPLPSIAGLCRSCYFLERRSARLFGGNRARALERDGRQCQGCGETRGLHVHHRRPGDHRALVTVCAACHARIHRTLALRRWMPDGLLALWREWHPGTPEQLQLALAPAASTSATPGSPPR